MKRLPINLADFLDRMDLPEGEVLGLEPGGIDSLPKAVNLNLLKPRLRNHIELKERNDLVRERRDLRGVFL